MAKLNIFELAVELTRRCDMNCAHCLRGPAQNKDLDLDKFDTFLQSVAAIDTIVFTGGEPTLNIPAMEHILETCKTNNIDVSNFYVVTNGKAIQDDDKMSEFLKVLIDWYVYCISCGGDPELSGLALSLDKYHEDIDPEVKAKLSALSFFRQDDKETDFNRAAVINLGNARTLTDVTKRNLSYSKDYLTVDQWSYNGQQFIRVEDAIITFTCDGDILHECDYEYTSTDDIKICDYKSAYETFKNWEDEADE